MGRNSHRFLKTILIGKENWKGRKKVSRKEGGQQSGDAISDARVSLLQAYLGALRAQVPTEVSWPSLHEAGVRYFPTWVAYLSILNNCSASSRMSGSQLSRDLGMLGCRASAMSRELQTTSPFLAQRLAGNR